MTITNVIMSSQSSVSLESREVAAIGSAVDRIVNSQEVQAVSNRNYNTMDSTPHVSSDDDLQNQNNNHATTNSETMISLLKGNIGPGIFALPQAFMNAGLYVGLFLLPLLGGICIHCMHTLLKYSRELSRRHKLTSLSYEETAEMCFKHGPRWSRGAAKPMRNTTMTSMCLTQLGFCCVYNVFMSQNLKQASDCIVPGYI